MCFFLEFIRWFRLYRTKQRIVNRPILQGTSRDQSMGSVSPSGLQLNDSLIGPPKKLDVSLMFDGLLHAAQLTLGYMLMLIFVSSIMKGAA